MSDDNHRTASDIAGEGEEAHADPNFGHNAPLPYFGTKLYQLPDGQAVHFTDTIWHDLRSAFVVRPWGDEREWAPFSYGRNQDVPGAPEVKATPAHTNIVRSGEVGLPKDWEMLVCRWRATLNVPLSEAVLAWAAETAVQFEYNSKLYGSATLADLLLSTQPMASPSNDRPIHMRENLGYCARVRTGSERSLEGLRASLCGDAPTEAVRDAIVELGTVARMQQGTLADTLRHIQAKLQPGRNLICWLHIEGPLVRTVV
jgi:hypothetical protein